MQEQQRYQIEPPINDMSHQGTYMWAKFINPLTAGVAYIRVFIFY